MLAERMSVQRLTSPPFSDPLAAVRSLTCVQSQDAPLARYSLGLRTATSDGDIRAALDSGTIVRTHILRPTWHFVAADDLRWILALTSSKVESAMAARHRQLALTPPILERTLELLNSVLAGRRFMTRPELGTTFAEAGLPCAGEQVGHLLLLAELRAVVCSAPLRGSTHTYGLVDELIPASTPLDRPGATRQLVERFFRGHGPALDTDLNRWTKLTLTDIRRALDDLREQGTLVPTTVGGDTLWSAPEPPKPAPDAPRAFLLPVFDEAYLTYPRHNFPRAEGHPRGDRPHSFAEAGGGVVVLDRHDVGWWKRKETGSTTVVVRLAVAASLGAEERTLIDEAAVRLAAFTGRTLDLVHEAT
jgi:Winged helix DNA-binding domain